MLDVLADTAREQCALTMEASAAMCRGFEAMRAVQQRAAQQASTRHLAAARALHAASAPTDLLATALGFAQREFEATAGYWQELAGAALEAQTELLGCASTHVLAADTALETAAALEALETTPIAAALPRRAARPARRTRTGA